MGRAKKPLQIALASSFVKQKVAGRGRWHVLLALGLFLGLPAALAAQDSFDTGALARVLEKYVTPNGQVRYADLKAHPGNLEEFIGQLAALSPENRPDLFPTPAAQMAYWLNAYNAFVLHAVVKAYPIDSVRDLRFGFGVLFFKRAQFVAGGKAYSLDDIEHGILRQRFADPRIHFAVNCASTSCPPVPRQPFEADQLEKQLEQAASNFMARQENVWMRGDVLFLSKIFDWYGDDFLKALERQGVKNPTVVDYVLRYLPASVAERVRQEKPRLEFYRYDWSLNDASVRAD
ncbi:MAG: DUF547 domain-containing protein [Candidatus Acidiferrales bacterium]